MTAGDARCIVYDACVSWAAADLDGLRSLLLPDLVFAVYSRPGAPSLVGEGRGRTLFLQRLGQLLEQVEVLQFHPICVTTDGFWHQARVRFLYRHRNNGIAIEGRMRLRFAFVGLQIAHFELFHDTHRMRAFYRMGRLPAFSA